MEIQNNFAEQTAEVETETPPKTQNEAQSEEEIDQSPKILIKGTVKWEKRSSERKTKKT